MIFERNQTEQSKIKQKESSRGRSMVEMIAMLTVLALLSIGGIYGYRVAMNKYAAGVLIGEMNDISQHITLDLMKGNVGQLLLAAPYDKGKLQRTDYDVAYGCRGSTSVSEPCQGVHSYFVQISGIPYWVCYEARPLLRRLKWTETMYVNETEDGYCAKDQKNTILSVFNIDGYVAGGTGIITDPKDKDKSCVTDEDCGYTSNSGLKKACVRGQCVGCVKNEDCLLQFVCNKETGVCENPSNKCASDAECAQRNAATPYCSAGKQCVACSLDSQCSSGECHTESASCFSNNVKTGVCLKANKQTFKTEQPYLYFSGATGSWWDAKRWCSENGYHMVSLKDLGCVHTESGVCLDANGELPAKLQAIRDKIGGGFTCVTDRKTACLNYKLDLASGQITTQSRSAGCHVLCR